MKDELDRRGRATWATLGYLKGATVQLMDCDLLVKLLKCCWRVLLPVEAPE